MLNQNSIIINRISTPTSLLKVSSKHLFAGLRCHSILRYFNQIVIFHRKQEFFAATEFAGFCSMILHKKSWAEEKCCLSGAHSKKLTITGEKWWTKNVPRSLVWDSVLEVCLSFCCVHLSLQCLPIQMNACFFFICFNIWMNISIINIFLFV